MAGRIFTCLAVLATLLAAAPLAAPAHAWTGFTTLPDTPLDSDPSCALESPEIAICAAIGPGSELMYNIWNGSGWRAWAFLPGVATSAPSCSGAGVGTSQLTGKVVCAARDIGLNLMAVLFTGGKPSAASVTVDVALGSAPSCTPLSGNSASSAVLCAGRSPTGQLVAALYNGSGAWSSASWTTIAPQFYAVNSPVSCTAGGPSAGEAVCAWLTKGNAVEAALFNGTTWSAEVDLGGAATNPPACVGYFGYFPEGVVFCFVTGADSGLWFNEYGRPGFTTANWLGWNSLGGLVHGFSCGLWGAGLDAACGVTELTNSGFGTIQEAFDVWGGWVQQGAGAYIGNPSCLWLNPGQGIKGEALCVVTEENGQAASIIGP
jgi:hypothetical protein